MMRMTGSMLLAAMIAGTALTGTAWAQSAPGLGAVGGFQQDPSQPIEIAADALEVRQETNKAIFTGSVDARQGQLRLQAERVEVDYAEGGGETDNPDGAIRHFRAEGDVFITNSEETAQGDWADYDVETGIVTMGDDVILTQGGSALRGRRLNIDLNTGLAKLLGGGGRVQGVFVRQETQ